MRISRARPDEYDAIQRYLEDAYGLPCGFFPADYPHLWRKEHTDFRNILLIRQGGAIASLVRIFPMTLVCADATIPAGGIGAVSTSPSFRGRGYMTALMREALSAMRADGYAVSVLWGDRQRYSHFGYEHAGTVYELTFSSRSIARAGLRAAGVRRWLGERDLLTRIHAAYLQQRSHAVRTITQTRQCLMKRDCTVYVWEQKGEFAYAVRSGWRGQIVEHGGSPAGILRILIHLDQRFGAGALTVPFPGRDAVADILLDAAAGWCVRTTGMVRILDPVRLCTAYRRHFERCLPDGAELSLGIEGETGAAVSSRGGRASVRAARHPDLCLSSPQASRLVFGPCAEPLARRGTTAELCGKVFPLPFFIWPTDHC